MLLAVVLAAAPAAAQEIAHVAPRPGVTQSFFVADMGRRQPRAVAMLLIGGGGNLKLRMEDGKVRFAPGNFLARARGEFIRNDILPVLVDAPGDHREGMSDAFRESPAHALDLGAVAAELTRRYPGLPVFLVGTSRSTLSVAHAARFLKQELAGAVLTASLFRSGAGPRAGPALSAFDWKTIPLPLLFVHHREDGCGATPYFEAARLGREYPLVSVQGGKDPASGPCDPFSAHGFYGKEAQTVDAIAAWMLGKPFSKQIR
jgi:hypothetical protein